MIDVLAHRIDAPQIFHCFGDVYDTGSYLMLSHTATLRAIFAFRLLFSL